MWIVNVKLVTFFIILTASRLLFSAEDPHGQLKIAIEMCYRCGGDEGFVAASAALEKHKNDKAIAPTKKLREAMTLCLVSSKYLDSSLDNANEVIKISNDPLALGCAWFQKSRFALINENYENAFTYSAIALKTFEKIPSTSDKGSLAWKDIFSNLCQQIRNECGEFNSDTKSDPRSAKSSHL